MRHPLIIVIGILVLSRQGSAAPGDYLFSTYGGRASFVIIDEDLVVDAGFEIGSHAGFAFDLGRWGQLHCVPMISWWFGGDQDEQELGYLVSEVDLNLLDYRYYFPSPTRYMVRPYIGAAPMGAITIYQQDFFSDSLNEEGERVVEEERDIGWDFGLNLLGGVDFAFTETFRMFTEVRIKRGDWDVAKLSLGFSFMVR
ncbi:MAG: hypothetical protein ACOC41_02285 [Chitinivibrionales bacterium]